MGEPGHVAARTSKALGKTEDQETGSDIMGKTTGRSGVSFISAEIEVGLVEKSRPASARANSVPHRSGFDPGQRHQSEQ